MKSLSKNPFFYLSLALALLVGLQVYGIVAAQYTPPTEPPTGGMPARPLNTGTNPESQYRAGSLGAGTASNNILLSTASGVRQLLFTEGAQNAAIKIDPSSGKLFFRNAGGTFQEFGTGTGGAGWALAANETDIYNSNTGNVGIGLTNPTVKLQVAGDVLVGASPVVQRVYQDSGKMSSGWVENKYRLLICDNINTGDRECFGDYSTTDATGAVKYDNFEVDLEGIKEKVKEEFVVVEITTATGGKLTVGNISVGDINMSSPKWSKIDVVIEAQGEENNMANDFIENWTYCPEGYFMIGFRLGAKSNDTLYPLIQCAKL